MMSGKEKLYFLLNRIEDVRAIAPSGQPLKIDSMNDLSGNYRDIELDQLFTKLEIDEKVLRILKVPSRINIVPGEFDPHDYIDDDCWHIELLPLFDAYFTKIQNEVEYQKFTGKKLANSFVSPGNNFLTTYDSPKGILELEGKKIKFNKDSFRAKLLELLLKDEKTRKKEWSWDEVVDEIQGTKGNSDLQMENKKKFYPACDGLSKLIAQKTRINDFLLYTKSTVQINSRFL